MNRKYKPELPENSFDYVFDGIFIGDYRITDFKEFDAVITTDPSLDHHGVLIKIPIHDTFYIPQRKLENLVEQLDFWQKRGEVIVVSHLGLNRAPLIVASWMAKYRCMHPIEAIELLRNSRSDQCFSNQAFVNHLMQNNF